MITELEHIKQEAIKNRIWIISAMAICLIIAICVVLFYKPKFEPDNTLIEAKNREMKALELQTVAFQTLIREQANRIESLKNRDSILLKEIVVNGEAIRKIKTVTNEKIKAFDYYGSDDWAKYYRDLPEPK